MPDCFNSDRDYDEVLNKGLRLSGENKEFFIRGRILDMIAALPRSCRPARILDFGCGTGTTCRILAEFFPEAQVVGVDSADKPLKQARETVRLSRVSFNLLKDVDANGGFDLCYVNGVFHHIEPEFRPEIINSIRALLKPGAYLSFFENNPWNPGTRIVMRLIPFDRESVPLYPSTARRLIKEAGLEPQPARFLFYFPKILSPLRLLEPALTSLPLGAQYHILALNGASSL
ncbi:MAG: class I SAM-dependent methyltransferase [Elusimicrobiota bacterium]